MTMHPTSAFPAPPRRWLDPLIMAALVVFILVPVLLSIVLPAPLTYENLPFPVLNSPITAGKEVFLDVRRCTYWRSTLTYLVTRELRNETTGAIYLLASTPATLAPDCTSVISSVNAVPSAVPPGTYTFHGTGRVGGWLRAHDVLWHTQAFEVIAPGGTP